MLMVHLAIRVETAREIEVELIKITLMINQNINVALIGNPNTENFGFNQLTGLNQQVGIIRNYG
jgi:hypothetical protein